MRTRIDGLHIAALLIALFCEHMKPLIEAGLVYVVDSPLFMAQLPNGRHVFGHTKAILRQKLGAKDFQRAVNSGGIHRFKGHGESSTFRMLTNCRNAGVVSIGRVSADENVRGLKGWRKVSEAFIRPKRKRTLLRLITNKGYFFECTKEHRLWVIGANCELQQRSAGSLTTDDYLTVCRNLELAQHDADISGFTHSGGACKTFDLPKKMTPALARWLGYLTADAYVFNGGFNFTKADPDIMADFKRCCQRVLGEEPNLRSVKDHKGNKAAKDQLGRGLTETWGIGSQQVGAFIKYLGLEGTARDKQVPWCIRQSSRPIVREFLFGLFSGDGSVTAGNNPHVDVSSASRTMMDQVHLLLLNFGIIGHKYYLECENNYIEELRPGARIDLEGENIDRFLAEIGIVESKAAAHVPRERNANKDKDGIPYLKDAVLAIRARSPNCNNGGRYVTDDGREVKAALGMTSVAVDVTYQYLDAHPESLASLVAVAPALCHNVQQLLKQRPYFDRLERIEEFECNEHLYDLEVPNGRAYAANGVLSHNSNVEQIREYAMENATRRLFRVEIDPKKGYRLVRGIMGEDVTIRKRILHMTDT